MLAEGIEIRSAELHSGLLEITLVRKQPRQVIKKIPISQKD